MNELPPNNEQAEQAVLGEIIIGGCLSFAKALKPDDFYQTKHRLIFEAMLGLEADGDPIDLITLSNALKNKGKLEETGGASYLAGVTNQAVSTSLLPAHIKIVKEEAIKRLIIEKGHKTTDALKNADLTALLSELRGFYGDLALMPSLEGIAFFDYEALLQEGKAYAQRGKETGLYELDRAVKIMPKELIIIGARVRHGKSSFAYNLLLNFLEKYEDEAFIFFNLDVPSTIVMTRLATIHAKKHAGKTWGYKDVLPSFQTLQFNEGIVNAFAQFDKYGKDKRLAVVNTPNYTVEQIIAHAERLAKEKTLGAIFVDYIELIKTQTKTDSEELRISHIVNQLRIASERLSCPVIALAQMNRASVTTKKKPEERRPTLEGLRYSGRQEQEATTVLGLFNINAEKIEIEQETNGVLSPSTSETVLEIIPLKNRGGESNRVISLDFDMVSGYIATKEKTGFAR